MTTPSTERTAGAPVDDSEDSLAPLDADERFHLLQNERRRLVIRYLRDADTDTDADPDADPDAGRVWMRDIAERVAAWEHDTTVAALSSTERQRVYIPLYQNHLPKLDEAGVIEYNQSRGVVVPTERVDRLGTFVEGSSAASDDDADDASADDADADRWNNYYLGASGASALMLGGAAMSLLPGFAVAVTILALFSTVSLSQYQRQVVDDGSA